MDLRTFIKQALLDVVNGVKDAQREAKCGHIVPAYKVTTNAVSLGISPIQIVEIEVVVSADESSGQDGKIGVVSGILNGGVSAKTTSESSNQSKLKLRVPVMLPSETISAEPEEI